MNFWKNMHTPIFALAPMADVTDAAFRRIIAKYSKVPGGAPFVMWTEFVSADGLVSASEAGRKKLLKDLEYSEKERPIVAQLFTGRPSVMEKAAKIVAELGFNGLDINMGCPDRSIEKSGAGAALIVNPSMAREIIRAARKGVALAGKDISVSVKTRIGYSKNEIDTWIPVLLSEKIDALIIHLRTRKEMSAVPAHWEEMEKILKLRDEISPETLIVGNGDVKSIVEAKQKISETLCDGVMLGRAIFGTPNLFQCSQEHWNRFGDRRSKEAQDWVLDILVEHTNLFEEILGDVKNFAIMKKHFKAYVSGWDGAVELRKALMDIKTARELEGVVRAYQNAKRRDK